MDVWVSFQRRLSHGINCDETLMRETHYKEEQDAFLLDSFLFFLIQHSASCIHASSKKLLREEREKVL